MDGGALPGAIRKLDEAVVNRIAAGEVIQRPANALKEMLENSLDAGAKSVQVTVNQGGLKLLQIRDDGTGIRKDDLLIVCERFTTSKLRKFEDLSSIATYGFRGEALASISHVARLQIVSKTVDDVCGYKVEYSDGKPLSKPVPCAATQGCQLTVEDLFYNVLTRKRALKSASDEFHRVADVVSKYAIHNSGTSFTLKKENDQHLYVRTQKDSSTVDNIGVIFGQSIAKELQEVTLENQRLKFKLNGLITNVNFNTKKFNFLLFINHRLVESSALKKAIEMVYTAYLPKGSHPFVYMSLEVAPENVDVNVHPTKHEVHFLHQEDIIESIQQAVDAKLLGSNASRTFRTQAILPEPSIRILEPSEKSSSKVEPKNLVRTDAREQKLDRFLISAPSVEPSSNDQEVTEEQMQVDKATVPTPEENGDGAKEIKDELVSEGRREIKLTSVKLLRDEIKSLAHEGLRDVIRNHSFVGCVSRELALIQHSTYMYVVNVSRLSEELFYQLLLRDFGNFAVLRLSPPAPLMELARMALDSEEAGWNESDGDKDSLARCAVNCLLEKSEMLNDYFSVEIDDTGNLVALPLLIDGFVPFLAALPMFVLRLATEVTWHEEEACFRTFCREVARFYAIKGDETSRYDTEQHHSSNKDVPSSSDHWRRQVEDDILGMCKRLLQPPGSMANDMTFAQVANLPDLYKVFERC